MKASRSSRGYTIVEVMIFLAVSGFMFLIAAIFVTGKQAKVEFTQGMNDMNSQVQSVINDVSNGFFPSNGDFTCNAGDSGPPNITSSGSIIQGANRGCVFLGKVIQFSVQGTDDLGYNVYTIAARQFKSAADIGSLPTSFAEAQPVLASNLTDRRTTEWGLRITKVTSASSDIDGVGFFSSFGTPGAGGTLESGSQNLAVVPITGTTPIPGESESAFVGVINGGASSWTSTPSPDIVVCLDDNSNSQFGALTIGGPVGQRLTTSIKVGNTAAAVGC